MFLCQPISEYWNRTTILIPFLQAIKHFCNFIPSYFMKRFAFLIDDTSYILYMYIHTARSTIKKTYITRENRMFFIHMCMHHQSPFSTYMSYFARFVPNLNLTFKLVLHFMVFKTGQRADFNAKDFLVLKVGDIYTLDNDEI